MHAVQERFSRADLAAGRKPDLNEIRKRVVIETLKEYEFVQFHEAVMVPHASGDGVVVVVRMKVARPVKEAAL